MQGRKIYFLGVSDLSKAYKLYNPIIKKTIFSHGVVSDEDMTWPWSDNVVRQ